MSVVYKLSESSRQVGVPEKPNQSLATSGARVKTRLLRRSCTNDAEEDPASGQETQSDCPERTHPYGSITVIGGPGRGTSFDLTEGFMRIGRDPSQEIQLAQDDAISRESHAVVGLDSEHGRFMIFDGGKVNPVWVNGTAVADSVFLENGDIIRIGETTLCLIYA